MKKSRRKFDSAFKAKVGIEGLKERQTLSELAVMFDLHPNQISQYFQAYDDWMLAEKAREAQLDYLERSMNYQSLVDVLEYSKCLGLTFCFCDPYTMELLSDHPITKNWKESKKAKACRKKFKENYIAEFKLTSNKYKKGAQWFTNANKLWEVAIGGYTEEEFVSTCSCTLLNMIDESTSYFEYAPLPGTPCGINIQYNIMPEPDWTEWGIGQWTEHYAKRIVAKDHDGAVLAESARDLPFITNSMKDSEGNDLSKLDGSGHMQMRNDDNLKNALNHIYNGDVGSTFQTKKISE